MVKSLLWLSDTHLNVLTAEQHQQFLVTITSTLCDAMVITGDIAEPPVTENFLQQLAMQTSVPIYFVLGNHDYYGTTVSAQRALIEKISQTHPSLYFLTRHQPIPLTPQCILLGIDSWPDGRSSDFLQCTRELLDKEYIQDLIPVKNSKQALVTQLQQLADADVATLTTALTQVVASGSTQLLVMTHVPPWYGTAEYALSPRDQTELSHFTCWALGQVLHDFAISHPGIQIVHLAGHVHHAASYSITANYRVITAAATVGKPNYQHLDLEKLLSDTE